MRRKGTKHKQTRVNMAANRRRSHIGPVTSFHCAAQTGRIRKQSDDFCLRRDRFHVMMRNLTSDQLIKSWNCKFYQNSNKSVVQCDGAVGAEKVISSDQPNMKRYKTKLVWMLQIIENINLMLLVFTVFISGGSDRVRILSRWGLVHVNRDDGSGSSELFNWCSSATGPTGSVLFDWQLHKGCVNEATWSNTHTHTQRSNTLVMFIV